MDIFCSIIKGFSAFLHVVSAGLFWFLLLPFLLNPDRFTLFVLIAVGLLSVIAGGCSLEALVNLLFFPLKILGLKTDPYDIGY